MAERMPLVSIVCPAYQEEEVLPIFHRELCAVLDGLETRFRFEVVYVDDGSCDRTLDVLRRLTLDDRRVRFLSLSRNFGHQAALTAGLEHARGDVIISMDSDLQHPPAVLPLLLEKWRDGFEVVITVREDDRRLSLFKRFTSQAFYAVMRRFSDTEIRMAASDFRLLSRRALLGLLQMREGHRFLRGMVQWLGFPCTEIAFAPDERRAGQSKYTVRRMLHLAGDGLFSFSRLPLRLPLYLGALVGLLGLTHAVWYLLRAAFGAAPPAGFHYLLFVTHLIGGGLLCSVGVVGEYLARVHEQVKGRPLYVLKEASDDHAAPPQREAA